MTTLAYKGEKIKGRDGKVIATVAEDIHSGDINLRPNQFVFENPIAGAYLPEEIHDFLRDRLSAPPEQKEPESEPKPTKGKK